MRARMSPEEPAATAITIFTGRVGQSPAAAANSGQARAAVPAARRTSQRRLSAAQLSFIDVSMCPASQAQCSGEKTGSVCAPRRTKRARTGLPTWIASVPASN